MAASRALPSFHGGFIALTSTSYKSWSVPVRAKPCENRSFAKSLILTGFFVFSIYLQKSNFGSGVKFEKRAKIMRV